MKNVNEILENIFILISAVGLGALLLAGLDNILFKPQEQAPETSLKDIAEMSSVLFFNDDTVELNLHSPDGNKYTIYLNDKECDNYDNCLFYHELNNHNNESK